MKWIKVKEQTRLARKTSQNGVKTARRVFVAVSDTRTTPVAAETASHGDTSIPKLVADHPDDPSKKVRRIAAFSLRADGRKFRVEVGYSTAGLALDHGDDSRPPQDERKPDATDDGDTVSL